jgi:alpha-D-ribose 1-methylphosphonate 5-phosphate C-P lyase
MTPNYEALKLCPIYKREQSLQYPKVARMTVCDTYNFFSADFYIAVYDVSGDKLMYVCSDTIHSEEFAEWLKQYGVVLNLLHTSIARVDKVSSYKYVVSIEGKALQLCAEAYSEEQAEHDAAKALMSVCPYAETLTYNARRI